MDIKRKNIMSLFSKIRRRLSHAQIMALGFLTVIIIGTVLLMLPVSSRTGQWTPFIKALFTSVSSTCVTGLVVQLIHFHTGHYSDR